jgi:hypothetical protein
LVKAKHVSFLLVWVDVPRLTEVRLKPKPRRVCAQSANETKERMMRKDMDAFDAVEGAVEEVKSFRDDKSIPIRGDATTTVEAVASERMKTLINDASASGRQQLTEARDKIDDLMRAPDARGKMLADSVTEYSGFVQQAVEMKSVIMGSNSENI